MMEYDANIALELYMTMKKEGLETLARDADVLYQQMLILESNALARGLDESQLRILVSETTFFPDSLAFWNNHRVGIFGIKAEMMRYGLDSDVANFKPEAMGTNFYPPHFNEDVEDWTNHIIETGHTVLGQTNVIQTSKGALEMAEGFFAELIPKLAKINKYRFLNLSHIVSGVNMETIVKETSGEEVRSFNLLGTETFSELITTCISEIIRKKGNAETKRNTLLRMTNDEGLIGQLMRVGGDNINNFEEKYIAKPSYRFKNEAPIIIEDDGFMSLDPERIVEDFPEVFAAHSPELLSVRGKTPCPANQVVGEEDDSKIIKKFVQKVIRIIPDNFLAA